MGQWKALHMGGRRAGNCLGSLCMFMEKFPRLGFQVTVFLGSECSHAYIHVLA